MAKNQITTQVVDKTKTKVVDETKGVFIPRMSAYQFAPDERPKCVKRKAKYAPQLLADGLTSGIVSDQANLVHGAFDDGIDVDPFADIHSDKFAIMQAGIQQPSVDPSSLPNSVDSGTE